jgi:DNA-binding NtrC family response regulator
MHAEQSGADTKPEERPRGGSHARPVLLVASVAGRVEIALPESGTLTIGRGRRAEAATSDVADGEAVHALPDDLLSRRHLRITCATRGYLVEDLGSRNGTYLDGHKLAEPARLSPGSILCFGRQIAVFREVCDAERAAIGEEAATPFGPVPTFSPALASTFARLRRLARTDTEILLIGETGVGKEVCARAVHAVSGRRGPFVAINCASLSAALVEPGLVESAQGGTLLLDEIGDMPAELLTKIFRSLQDRTVSPPGAVQHRRFDVRIIAATTHIDGLGTGGPVSRDLLARLGGDPIAIPPLRERPEDVPGLLAHFAAGALDQIEPAALRALCLYSWPLNVRELEKATRSAIALCDDRDLRLEHLPAAVRAALDRGPLITARRRAPRAAPERAQLEQLLRQHEGNVAEVARALDRNWNVVWRWIVRLRLNPEKFRRS